MPNYELIIAKNAVDQLDYHNIRRVVLFEPLGRKNYDPNYESTLIFEFYPLLLKYQQESIGTTRLDIQGNIGIMRLVAIRADLQRQGHGRALQNLVEAFARDKGANILWINAAREALEYYYRMGFVPFTWDLTELTGIAENCVQMQKILEQHDNR